MANSTNIKRARRYVGSPAYEKGRECFEMGGLKINPFTDSWNGPAWRAGWKAAADAAALPTLITPHERFNGEYQSGFVA